MVRRSHRADESDGGAMPRTSGAAALVDTKLLTRSPQDGHSMASLYLLPKTKKRDGLVLGMSVKEYVADGAGSSAALAKPESHKKMSGRRWGIFYPSVQRQERRQWNERPGLLSGGNQQKWRLPRVDDAPESAHSRRATDPRRGRRRQKEDLSAYQPV